MNHTKWRQLKVQVPAELAEPVEQALTLAGALSTTTSGVGDEELFVAHALEANSQSALWQRCWVVALFDFDVALDAAQQAIADLAPSAAYTVETLGDEDWLSRSAAALSLEFGGGHLRLAPRDEAQSAALDGPPTVFLDAGLAFGSGSHPTTRMCLERLASAALAGKHCLDYGCGSGILALAMCKLGARGVVGVDIDPQAVLATRENAHYNGVPESQLQVLAPGQFQPKSQFDVVVANILANPLIELAPMLVEAVAVGGTLTLTGVLQPQAAAVVAAYPTLRLSAVDQTEEDGAVWVCLEGQRHATT